MPSLARLLARPFAGFGERLLESLARRISERVQQRLCAPREHAPLPDTSHGTSIRLDYPVRPRPRWGASWNLPSHARLAALVRSDEERTRACLELIASYRDFLRRIPVNDTPGSTQPAWLNEWLPGLDATSLYAFVARGNPATYLEVGSGNSTKFVRRAISDHGLRTRIISIDPHPRAEIDALCDEVIRQPLEDCDLAAFSALGAGDVCFVDNSHCCFQNSDVTVMFLEALPRLAPGVRIGFHDIFLPDDYPATWSGRHYSEQYVLAAYLLGGHAGTEIVLPVWDASQRPELAAIVAPIWEGEEFASVQRHGNTFWLETCARPAGGETRPQA